MQNVLEKYEVMYEECLRYCWIANIFSVWIGYWSFIDNSDISDCKYYVYIYKEKYIKDSKMASVEIWYSHTVLEKLTKPGNMTYW